MRIIILRIIILRRIIRIIIFIKIEGYIKNDLVKQKEGGLHYKDYYIYNNRRIRKKRFCKTKKTINHSMLSRNHRQWKKVYKNMTNYTVV